MIEGRVGYMVNSQQGKGYRVLSMFDRLMNGQGINKKQEALTHQVGEKPYNGISMRFVRIWKRLSLIAIYNMYEQKKMYKLLNQESNRLSKEQVLVIVKILIASKALIKSDIGEIVEQLLSQVAVDRLDRNIIK